MKKNNFNQIDIENVLLAYNDGDLIHGILVNNNYIPLKPQKVNNTKLKKLKNYEYSDIEDILYINSTKYKRDLLVHEFIMKGNLYKEFKNYFYDYFERNQNIKKKLKYIINNNVFFLEERRKGF